MSAPLWEPTPERIERANLVRFAREQGLLGRLRRAVGLVGGRHRALLGGGVALLRRRGLRALRARARRREMPGAEWFPGARLSLRAPHLPRQGRRRARHPARLRAARARLVDVGRAARADRAHRRRAAPAGRGRGRSRGGVPAEHPRGGGGVPRLRLDRGRLVVVLARLRRAQRGGPVRADRAEGAARRGRLPLRRQGLRPLRARGAAARGDAVARAGRDAPVPRMRPDRRRALVVRARGRARAARVRRAAVRPPAVGPVLVRHHRPAQADRPGPGRDPARAPEEDASAPRRARRRPRVLVHHHGLDDVELPRRRAAHAGVDRALRRQSRPPGPRHAVGPRGARRDHHVRHERQLHRVAA